MSTTQDVAYHMGGVPVHGAFTTGKCWFVNSEIGSDGNTGKKPTQAFATLDKATNMCTANKGDIVYIMPNHNETLSAATTWVPDVAGVRYIGIGMGTDAPVLTLSATTSVVTVAADNVSFENITFMAGVSAVLIGSNVTGDHVRFLNCRWDFSTTLFSFDKMIEATGADNLIVKDCKFISEIRTTGPNCAIHLDDTDYLEIRDNLFTGKWDLCVLRSDSTDAGGEGVNVLNNHIYQTDTLSTQGGIRFDSTMSGVISGNRIGWLGLSTRLSWTIHGGNCLMFDNIVSNAPLLEGISTVLGPATT